MSLSKDDKIKMLSEDLERSIETGDMELHERTRLEFYNMTAEKAKLVGRQDNSLSTFGYRGMQSIQNVWSLFSVKLFNSVS